LLKGITYAAVALCGMNDPFVHLLRAYQRYRTMIGMKCMTDDRLERLRAYIAEYEKYCSVRSCDPLGNSSLIE
jgi:hypothetical protein